ncbi:hypothetical protein BH11BAC5_BH11BAC5_52000 [soil metagenome]
MIKSKFRRTQICFVITVFVISVVAIIALFKFSSSQPDGSVAAMTMAFFIFFYAILVIYNFIKNAPVVVFTSVSIVFKHPFKTTEYFWESVHSITLCKKENYTYLKIGGTNMECLSLTFHEAGKIILWDHVYSNLAEIRCYLNDKVKQKISDAEPSLKDSTLMYAEKKVYGRNPLFSFSALSILIMFIIFSVSFLSKASHSNFSVVAFLFPAALYFCAIGTQMNYFVVDQGSFIIKNYVFRWKNIRYPLKEINQFAFESQYRRSNTLRVITKDFKSKKYPADSLGDKQWRALYLDMTTISIPVRNDSTVYLGSL